MKNLEFINIKMFSGVLIQKINSSLLYSAMKIFDTKFKYCLSHLSVNEIS